MTCQDALILFKQDARRSTLAEQAAGLKHLDDCQACEAYVAEVARQHYEAGRPELLSDSEARRMKDMIFADPEAAAIYPGTVDRQGRRS